jgi:hypothetical protein
MTLRVLLLLLAVAGSAEAITWPGGVPVNVTPGPFGSNVSDVAWNPLTKTLWTVENSPGIFRKSIIDCDHIELGGRAIVAARQRHRSDHHPRFQRHVDLHRCRARQRQSSPDP